jgi:hypothetical protein
MHVKHRRTSPAPAPYAWLLAFLTCSAVPSMAQQVGVFLDPQGQSCVGEILPFGRADVYVLAFLDEEVEFNGAMLSLRLPGGVGIVDGVDGIVWPRDTMQSGNLLADTGLNLEFQRCPRVSGVVELFHMTLEDVSPSEDPRPNLLIEVGGATVDSLLLPQPQLKVCVDGDPGGGRLVPATGLRATLNCTNDCPCSVAVLPTTWSAVKRRYREE